MEELIKEKWNDILRILETDYDVSKIIIDTWIRTLEIFKVEDNTIYFYVDEKRGKHGVEYLHKKGYDIFLLSAIREILNDSEINIIIDEKNNYIPHNETGIDGIEQKLHREYGEGYYNAVKRSNLNPKYTFENFIVGDSNRHAYATCLAVRIFLARITSIRSSSTAVPALAKLI